MLRRLLSALADADDDRAPQVRHFNPWQGLQWFSCGWRIFQYNPMMWVSMCLMYMLVALLLLRIPLFGRFLLALITPAMAAGAFLAADELAEDAKRRPRSRSRGRTEQPPVARFSDSLIDAGRNLFGAFRQEDTIIPVLELSLVGLGVMLVVQTAIAAIAGSALLNTVQLGQIGPVQFIQLALAGVLAVALGLVLAMVLIYAIPLCVLRDTTILGGLYYACLGAAENLWAFLIYTIVLAAPFIAAATGGGVLLPLALGGVWLPIAVTSMFCSYRKVFR